MYRSCSNFLYLYLHMCTDIHIHIYIYVCTWFFLVGCWSPAVGFPVKHLVTTEVNKGKHLVRNQGGGPGNLWMHWFAKKWCESRSKDYLQIFCCYLLPSVHFLIISDISMSDASLMISNWSICFLMSEPPWTDLDKYIHKTFFSYFELDGRAQTSEIDYTGICCVEFELEVKHVQLLYLNPKK